MELPAPSPVPRAPRFPLALQLRYRCPSSDVWIEATTLNVSRTGLLLRPASELPAGGEVDLVMVLPPCDAFPMPRVRCLASVIRHGSGSEDLAALAIRRYHFLRPGDPGDGDAGEVGSFGGSG